MNKTLKGLLAGAAVLLLVLIGVVYSKTKAPVSPTQSGSQTVPTSPTTPTSPTAPTTGGAQGSVDASSVVDALIASAGEEKRIVDGAETETGIMNENDAQISAYGNIYEQSELN